MTLQHGQHNLTLAERRARLTAFQSGTPVPSRFEKQVWVGNWLDTLQRSTVQTKVILGTIQHQSFAVRQAGFHGEAKRGEQYQIGVSFALENDGSYSEPIPTVEGNRIYQIRVALAQYQAFPLIMGWALQWVVPEGWVATDTLLQTTYEEFVSNPTVITRTYRSPIGAQPAAFKIVVVGKYA